MGFPFLNGASKKRNQVIGVDLGGRVTKAVLVQRNESGLSLLRYALADAPVQKSFAVDTLSEHLKSIVESFETRTKHVSLAINTSDSLVRHADLPQMPIPDMRQVLKINSKAYLQQDLSNHVFDCHISANSMTVKPDAKPAAGPQKLRVLVAGAKRDLVSDCQQAVKNSGLIPDHFVPGLVAPLNTFELAMPEVYSKEVFALVDLGFKNTTIALVQAGELALSRVVGIGGDKITSGLAETLGISYAEAEGIKIGMPTEIQGGLESMVMPLGRELRASIDFFEHQYDKHVTQVYFSGGSARSELIIKILESELMIPCQTWNPTAAVQLTLPPQQIAEIEQVAPQLSVAIGAAAASF